ncbi:helix-turn-helix domain-containing protein [Mesorhizobium sp.]|nr:helix-turn-helix domain-containing protein [Mesorhizobium sp.]
MLGVRRPGVTVAIEVLEGNGLIRATRGKIVIRDWEGLIQTGRWQLWPTGSRVRKAYR